MVRLSVAALVFTIGSVAGYSGSFVGRGSSIAPRSKVKACKVSTRQHVGASIKMEDFGLFKGSKSLDYSAFWKDQEVISEVGLEKRLNQDGLRYKMNRTDKEAEEVGNLFGLPGFEVELPIIGKTYLGPPKVASIFEAFGFTATSNNAARQEEKMKAIANAKVAKKGVKGGEGATVRGKWLKKYGYPRLVGSGGIFYADQLSTDVKPMGGFNMGKSGQIWPVPKIVKDGAYGGVAGWGMKKNGSAIDNLPKETEGL